MKTKEAILEPRMHTDAHGWGAVRTLFGGARPPRAQPTTPSSSALAVLIQTHNLRVRMVTLTVAVLCWLSIHTGFTQIILDDTWADGTRNDQNLPTESAWFSSDGSLSAVPGTMTANWNTFSSSLALTYFTDGEPVTLGIGQDLVVTWVVTPSNIPAFVSNARGLRVGLFDSTGGQRYAGDGFSTGGSTSPGGAGYRGYVMNMSFAGNFETVAPIETRKRSNISSLNLMGASGDYTILSSGPLDVSGQPAFVDGVQYTFKFTVTRTGADTVSLTGSWTGGDVDISHTTIDYSGTSFSFDTFAVRPDGSDVTAGIWETTNLKVEILGDGEDPGEQDYDWTLTSAPIADWGAVACSANGSNIVAAVQNGPIYISTNAGTSWTQTSAPTTYYWSSLASSADGKTLVAAAFPGPIYVSTNSGATWIKTGAPSNYKWASVCCSADGTKIAAVPLENPNLILFGDKSKPRNRGGAEITPVGYFITDGVSLKDGLAGLPGLPISYPRPLVYLSSDAGATWSTSDVVASTASSVRPAWTTVAMSADGSKLIVAGIGYNSATGLWRGYFFRSLNSGSTWQQIYQPGIAWYAATASADASKMLVAGGVVYNSANQGNNWQGSAVPSANWFSVAISADGNKMLLAGFPTRIVSSTNSGATWVMESSPNLTWSGIATSADGSKSVAVVHGGGIWKSQPGQGGSPSQITIGEALDNPSLVWANSSEPASGGEWFGQTNISHDGVDAAQTGPMMDDLDARLETTVSGPGTVTFWWKLSSEQGYDYFRFHIDGVLQQQISGEVNWQQRSFSIPEGEHVLLWRYFKDLMDTAGQDTAWLDDVQFTPSSGFPTIITQPASRTVWPGANVTLSTVAVGGSPLSHQWYFNETNPITGATASSLTLNNVMQAKTGRYHVVVSNSFGSVPSGMATVALTNNGPATSVLLFVDSPFPSPYEAALTQLGYPFQKYTSATTFNPAVNAANRNNTLVIVDTPYYLEDLTSVRNFINQGGRALVQAYTLAADTALATALQITMERRFAVPPPVHNWSGSPFFHGLSSPLDLTEAGFNEDGQKFHLMPGGNGVAGFGDVVDEGEAAVVIGNAGRTIVNGFFLEDVLLPADAVRFAKNQIDFLINPILPMELGSPTWVDGEFQIQITGGRTGLTCFIEAWDDSLQWNTVTNLTLSSSPKLISVPSSAPWSVYRAMMLLP